MSNKFIKGKRTAQQQQAKKDRRKVRHVIQKNLERTLPSSLNTARTRRVIVDGLFKHNLKIQRRKEIGGVMHVSMDGGETWNPVGSAEGGAQ